MTPGVTPASQNRLTRAHLRCATAALLFGASTPALWTVADEIPALTLAGLLYLAAAAAVAPFARPWPSATALRADRTLVLASVVFGGALGPALLVLGLSHTSAASASVAVNMELPATLLVALVIFREHLGPRMVVAGALVTAAGFVLALEPGAGWDLGVVAIAAACACWGIDNGATARIDQLSPQQVTLVKGAAAGTTNVVLGVAIWGIGDADASALLLVALVGAVGYGLSITLWVRGAHDIGAARAQVIFATAPFIGAALSWLFLDESVLVRQVVAIALAALGVVISLRSSHTHAHEHPAAEHTHEHEHPDPHHVHTHPGEPAFAGRHTHVHVHAPLAHAHPHVPDLHHHHPH